MYMHTAETIYSRLRFYKKLTSLDSILFTAWRLDQLELLQIKNILANTCWLHIERFLGLSPWIVCTWYSSDWRLTIYWQLH